MAKYISENKELMKEWDWEANDKAGLDPNKLTLGSHTKVWWKCKLGHSFDMMIKQRLHKQNCPYCSNRRILVGYNDLATTHPHLAKEWHPTKNGNLTPSMVISGSGKKVWWKCPKCGYEWQTKISNRTSRGHGCLNCTHQATVSGANDLATLHSTIAKEWHPTKNGLLTPSDIRPKSNKKYWWKCSKCGHEWQASASSRVGRKSGCPACSGRVPRSGINDVFTVCPNIKQEWDWEKNKNIDPSRLSKGSHTKAWWKCQLGHSYEMTIKQKSAGAGCPYCSHHRVWIGFNDLKTLFPKAAEEWNYEKNKDLRPENFSAHSNRKVWWKCHEGHEYEMVIAKKTSGGKCPYCPHSSSHRVLIGHNDLATTHHQLVKEWDYDKNGDLTPQQVTSRSGKKVWWKCLSCNNSWKTAVANRVDGSGCPKCSLKKRIKSFKQNILKKKGCLNDPILLKEWNYEKNKDIRPEECTAHSNKKVWWKCAKGHEYQATIHMKSLGQGCPICSNHKLLTGFNDLQKRFPHIAKEWDYDKNGNLTPSQILATSTKKVWWKCNICNTSWQTRIVARVKKGAGCPTCGAKKRVEGHKLAFLNKNGSITNPLLLQEWNYKRNYPLTPKDLTPASNKYVWWKCSKCGHEWQAKVSNRSVLKRGCPLCTNHVIVKGKNDLATTHPHLAKEWHPTKNSFTPDTVTYGTRKKVWWICPKGHEYQATIAHRAHGTACPICNRGRQTSFSEQAFFYYVKQIYPDAINRYKDIFDNGMELDIYIPSIQTAVEYDGVFYHKQNKLNRELLKYEICKKNNIRLIRVKEADIHKNPEHKTTADFVYHIPGLGDTKKALDRAIFTLLYSLIPKPSYKLDIKTYDFNKTDDLKTSYFSNLESNSFYRLDIDINTERDKYKIREYMPDLKKNSLADLRQDLAREWHPTKNGHFTPKMVSLGSSRKAWWLCPKCGHEWEAAINHRVKSTGCPKCAIKRGGLLFRKAVEMLDPNTNIVIKEFISISEAGRQMKINSSNIGMVCKGQRPKAGGYKWRYKK